MERERVGEGGEASVEEKWEEGMKKERGRKEMSEHPGHR